MKVLNMKVAFSGALLAACAFAFSTTALAGGGQRMYRVTITNAMAGQPVAPSVIATHTAAFHLFELGPAPSSGEAGYDDYFALATMAETGYPFLVLDQVEYAPGVSDAVVLATSHTPPVLLPSESNSTTIGATGNAKYLTAVAMLGATNDAVYAVQGVPLPRGQGDVVHYWANAYDVGSEANDETAGTVGFLGAMDDDPMSGDGINTNGEGFIHVHPGIHGGGGLDPAIFDWRNPVVEVTIKRIQ